MCRIQILVYWVESWYMSEVFTFMCVWCSYCLLSQQAPLLVVGGWSRVEGDSGVMISAESKRRCLHALALHSRELVARQTDGTRP